ncbi:hypothetical protein K8I85_12365 [bacterium]|nr:hypothetical protein [bacterium]
MRKSLVFATLFVLVCSAAAFAGVPDPTRSGVAITSTPGLSCHWRFRDDGGLDNMTVSVTLRDAFDVPVAGCTTTAVAGNASLIVSDCQTHSGVSSAGGVVTFNFQTLGGRGDADILVTAQCSGGIGLNPVTFTFTGPNLNASTDPTNNVTLLDLAIFANGLSGPYDLDSDFDCDATAPADLSDLAILAGGIGKGCNDAP